MSLLKLADVTIRIRKVWWHWLWLAYVSCLMYETLSGWKLFSSMHDVNY